MHPDGFGSASALLPSVRRGKAAARSKARTTPGQVRTEHGSLVLLSQISSGGVDERAHHYLGRDRTAAVPAAEAPERRWRPLGTLERDGDPPRQPELLAVPSLEHQLGSGVEATNRTHGQQLLATGR